MKYRLAGLALLTGALLGIHLTCGFCGIIETTWGLQDVAEVEWMIWFVTAVLAVICIIRMHMLKRRSEALDTGALVLIALVGCIILAVISFTVMMDIKHQYGLFRKQSPF